MIAFRSPENGRRPRSGRDEVPAMSTVKYYAVMFLGLALLVATPFLGLRYPALLLLLIPLVLVWGVWVLKSYWTWVRSLGK
jgi:hypothetical protein